MCKKANISSQIFLYFSHPPLCIWKERAQFLIQFELSPFSYIKEGVESTVTNWLEVIVILHTLLYIARKRESSNKIRMSLQGIVIYNSLLYWIYPCWFFQCKSKLPLVVYNSLLYWIHPTFLSKFFWALSFKHNLRGCGKLEFP